MSLIAWAVHCTCSLVLGSPYSRPFGTTWSERVLARGPDHVTRMGRNKNSGLNENKQPMQPVPLLCTRELRSSIGPISTCLSVLSVRVCARVDRCVVDSARNRMGRRRTRNTKHKFTCVSQAWLGHFRRQFSNEIDTHPKMHIQPFPDNILTIFYC
jgi:hypothetical protein